MTYSVNSVPEGEEHGNLRPDLFRSLLHICDERMDVALRRETLG